MKLLVHLLCILVGTVHSFVFTMDVLIPEDDPAVVKRLMTLQPSHSGLAGSLGQRRACLMQDAKGLEAGERQPLIKKEWIEGAGGSPKKCTICFKKYTHEIVKISLLCDAQNKIMHSFCRGCLTEWSEKRNKNCPTCQRPFVLSWVLEQEIIGQAQKSTYERVKQTILQWLCCTYLIDSE